VSLSVSSGDAIGAVESVKSASDILTPIPGEIVEVNGTLEEKPSEINKSPEGSAWIAKIKVEDGYDVNSGQIKLLSAEEYQAFTEAAPEEEK
jgi:glycine cleavage system H protein